MKKILLSILTILTMTLNGKAQTKELQTGLIQTLATTAERFEQSNSPYLIDVIKDNVVVLQILHGGLIEQLEGGENSFNFSLNLTFDGEKENQDKFTALNISKEFKYYEWDGIPCYALNIGNDQKKAEKITLIVLEQVYGFNLKDQFAFEIHEM